MELARLESLQNPMDLQEVATVWLQFDVLRNRWHSGLHSGQRLQKPWVQLVAGRVDARKQMQKCWESQSWKYRLDSQHWHGVLLVAMVLVL